MSVASDDTARSLPLRADSPDSRNASLEAPESDSVNITLAFAPGTCSRVPMIALEEAGVPYRSQLIRIMKREQKSPAFLRLNPAGKVPALVVDGRPLSQNVAILMWIARAFPDAELLPLIGDELADAAILSRLVWCSADLHQLVTRMRFPAYSCDLPNAAEPIRAIAATAMAAQLAPVEADLAHQPWLLGETWSVLDGYFYWIWFRIVGAGFPPDRFPNLVDHHRRMALRPAVQRVAAIEAAAVERLEAEGLHLRFPEPPPIVLRAQ